MVAKKKAPQKKVNKRGVGKKRPPISNGVVSLSVSKETMDNIMTTNEPLIKKASEITETDNLKFELGRLRTFLTVFNVHVEFEGNLYLVQVDPLNRMVKFLEGGGKLDPEVEKQIDEWKEKAGPYNVVEGYPE